MLNVFASYSELVLVINHFYNGFAHTDTVDQLFQGDSFDQDSCLNKLFL